MLAKSSGGSKPSGSSGGPPTGGLFAGGISKLTPRNGPTPPSAVSTPVAVIPQLPSNAIHII
jgi:hypothetical protein